jgi:hypothetical protein
MADKPSIEKPRLVVHARRQAAKEFRNFGAHETHEGHEREVEWI